MAAIETLRPIIHGQIHVNSSNYYPKYSYRYTSFRDRFRVLHEKSNPFVTKSSLSIRPATNLYIKSRVSYSNSWGGGLGFLKTNQTSRRTNKSGVNNSSCEHDTESSGQKSESESNKVSNKREKGDKKGKGGWG